MLHVNRSANLAISTSVFEALPGKLDIKRHSSSILYIYFFLVGDYLSDFKNAGCFAYCNQACVMVCVLVSHPLGVTD